MSDLDKYLRWISQIRALCTVTLLASLAVGIMCIAGSFEPTLSVILGVLSGVVLIASIIGLFNMSNRVFEVEESFHRSNFETSMAIMKASHEAKADEITGTQ